MTDTLNVESPERVGEKTLWLIGHEYVGGATVIHVTMDLLQNLVGRTFKVVELVGPPDGAGPRVLAGLRWLELKDD